MKTKDLFQLSKTFNIVLKDINNNMQNHSYMLISPDDYILGEYAKYLAKMFFCNNKIKPCDECLGCNKITHNTSPDVLVYPLEDKLTVEESRNIVDDSLVLPLENNLKIYIINNFDKATIQAQNALLKTIEEPPKYVIFILTVQNESNVVNTIKSRSKKIYEPLLNKDLEYEFLKQYNVNNLNLLTNLSSGNLGRAITIIKNKNSNSLIELANDIFLKMKSSSDVLKYSSRILKYKDDYDLFLELMQSILRDIAVAKVDKEKLKDLDKKDELIELCNNYFMKTLKDISDLLIFAKQELDANCSVTGTFDGLLMKILEVKFYAKSC